MKKRSGPKPLPSKLPDFFRETPKGAAAKRGAASHPRRPESARKMAMKANRAAPIESSTATTPVPPKPGSTSAQLLLHALPPEQPALNDYSEHDAEVAEFLKNYPNAFPKNSLPYKWQGRGLYALFNILTSPSRIEVRFPKAAEVLVTRTNKRTNTKGKTANPIAKKELRVLHDPSDPLGGHSFVQSPPGTGKSRFMFAVIQCLGPELQNSVYSKGKNSYSAIVVGSSQIVDQHRESFSGTNGVSSRATKRASERAQAKATKSEYSERCKEAKHCGCVEVQEHEPDFVRFGGLKNDPNECRIFRTPGDPSIPKLRPQVVAIMTWQAMARSGEYIQDNRDTIESTLRPLDLLLFDECHIGGGSDENSSFPKIIQSFEPWKCIYVSATCGASDSRLLGTKEKTSFVHTFEEAVSEGLVNDVDLCEVETGTEAEIIDVDAIATQLNITREEAFQRIEQRQNVNAAFVKKGSFRYQGVSLHPESLLEQQASFFEQTGVEKRLLKGTAPYL